MACEAVVQADPRLAGGDAQARRRGLLAGMIDPWAAGYTGEEDAATERRILPPADLGALRAGRARLRAAGRGPRGRVRPRRDGGRRRRTTTASSRCRRRRATTTRERMATRTTSRASPRPRADLKPIEITQPEGPSFTVEGHACSWQKWRLRIGFTPREGLVLHDIGYEDRGTLRPIIYRASLAEMFVPYGDPAPDAPLQERLRHGRVRRRLAGEPARRSAATASARSATSTASSTTRTASRW